MHAAYDLAMAYHYGEGKEENFAKALELYHLAAENGLDYVMLALGKLFQDGDIVQEDLESALYWYEKARDAGNEEAKMEEYYPFPCHQCGKCCRYVDMIPEVSDLDRGDGGCRYLTSDNKCEIYSNRPGLCNGEYIYKKYYSQCMSVKKFHDIMLTLCEEIRGGCLDRLHKKIREVKRTQSESYKK